MVRFRACSCHARGAIREHVRHYGRRFNAGPDRDCPHPGRGRTPEPTKGVPNNHVVPGRVLGVRAGPKKRQARSAGPAAIAVMDVHPLHNRRPDLTREAGSEGAVSLPADELRGPACIVMPIE